MTVRKNRQAPLAIATLQLFPPSIQESLISDSEFRSKYGLRGDALIAFGNAGVSVRRSELFSAIRAIFVNPKNQARVKDEQGIEWRAELEEKDGISKIVMSYEKRRLFLPDISVLSSNPTVRLKSLARRAEEANLPPFSIRKWQETISSHVLSDEEMSDFQTDLDNTPVHVAAAIKAEIESGSSSITTMVPQVGQYYPRLVGDCKQCLNVSDYAKECAPQHVHQLMSWRGYEGLCMALLLSAHSLISSTINLDRLSEADLVRLYAWLLHTGDRISQVGAVELGLFIVDKHPIIEPYLKGIIEQIRDEVPDDTQSRFKLLSSLIILVDGELSRSKQLSDKPPFWRRLASIAQASLIERAIIASKGDIASITDWAMQARGQQYYLQNMIDLRREPRWYPDYVSPQQLKAEFIGRIIIAAQQNAAKIEKSSLRELLSFDGDGSLHSIVKFPLAYLPGPLEGGLESHAEPTVELLKAIEDQLTSDILEPESFSALLNSALIFRLDPQYAKLAAKALRAVKHQLRNTSNRDELYSVLRGLSTVAAVTRSAELAAEIKILIRRCRYDAGRGLTAEEAMWLSLIAAAAYKDLSDWCAFLGESITEIAFQSLESGEIERLHAHLMQMFRIVPELWCTCGKADAALSACTNIYSTRKN